MATFWKMVIKILIEFQYFIDTISLYESAYVLSSENKGMPSGGLYYYMREGWNILAKNFCSYLFQGVPSTVRERNAVKQNI